MTPTQLAKSRSEHAHQVALFAWCNMAANYGLIAANNDNSYSVAGAADLILAYNKDQISELNLLFAIHNQGHGDKIRGSIAKAEGVKAGVPDLFLPVTRPTYAGLFIEMKIKGNTQSLDQRAWFQSLDYQGYSCVVCYSWIEARDALL